MEDKYVERECKTHGLTTYVFENRGYYRCKKCRYESMARRRRKVKEILVEEAGGACIACGYARCMGALSFHHIDPATKQFAIAANTKSIAIAKLREEVKKCLLVCLNCHMEHENGLIDVTKCLDL